MTILFSNDDGYDAIGINSLYNAFADNNAIHMCAPLRQKSAFSHAINYYDHFQIKSLEGEVQGFALDSTPADCVRAALHGLLPTPKIVLSGINYGLNIAQDVFYSGTVGAAREACLTGILGVAFSMDVDDFSDPDVPVTIELFEYAAKVSRRMVDAIPESLMTTPNLVINVNFPKVMPAKGIKVSTLGLNRYTTKLDIQEKGDANYLKIITDEKFLDLEEGTDTFYLQQDYITVTALYNGAVVSHEFQEQIKFFEAISVDL